MPSDDEVNKQAFPNPDASNTFSLPVGLEDSQVPRLLR
jgi:hypothetical protein